MSSGALGPARAAAVRSLALRRPTTATGSYAPTVVAVLVIGYLTMTRSFAYLGLPPANVFIGEVALVGFFVWAPGRAVFDRWLAWLRLPGRLHLLSWALLLTLAWGVLTFARGISANVPVLDALKNLPINYYPLFLLVGLAVGSRFPGLLPDLVRKLAFFNAVYGTAYVLVLSDFTLTMPGAPDITVFGQPVGSAIAIVGLLAYHRHQRGTTLLLLANAFVLLAVQVRAEWLGLLLGLLVWGILAKRLAPLMATAFGVLALVGVISLAGLDISAASGRGGSVSVGGIVGRAIAPIDPQLASQFTDEADTFAGTASWRTRWWQAIWKGVHEDGERTLAGYGYGYPLADLVTGVGEDTRTPHNVFFYVLGYSGWIGVAVFAGLQAAVLALLLRETKRTGQAFGPAFWTISLSLALFGNHYETPFGAIPTYLVFGMLLAPLAAIAPSSTRSSAPTP